MAQKNLNLQDQLKTYPACAVMPRTTDKAPAAEVLFLDFDDVLNTAETLSNGELFAPANVAALNAILDRTEVKIVVTSMWRLGATVAELENLLVEAGVRAAGRVIGSTPCLADVPRGVEIMAWLEKTPMPVRVFVILDNRNDMGPYGPHLVQTDPCYGLVLSQVEDVVSLLAD